MKIIKCERPESLVGKTVAGVGRDGDVLIIRCVDGTVSCLTAEVDYDESAEIEWQTGFNAEGIRYRSAAEDAGLITHEDWRAAVESEKRSRLERLQAEIDQLKREVRE